MQMPGGDMVGMDMAGIERRKAGRILGKLRSVDSKCSKENSELR